MSTFFNIWLQMLISKKLNLKLKCCLLVKLSKNVLLYAKKRLFVINKLTKRGFWGDYFPLNQKKIEKPLTKLWQFRYFQGYN